MADFAAELEAYYRAHRTELIRAFRSWGSIENVDEAIQEAMLRLYARYAQSEDRPDNLNALVKVTIRNILTDAFRKGVAIPLGDVRAGADGQPVIAAATDEEEDMSADPALPSKFVSPEDQVAWKQMFHRILGALDAKWVHVASMAMLGTSPEEIGAVFGQNGYVLRRHARALVCRALAGFAVAGDPTAKLFSRDYCGATS